MILAHEQSDAERYFFFSYSSNGADKNEFISQFTCLQLQKYNTIKDKIHNQ